MGANPVKDPYPSLFMRPASNVLTSCGVVATRLVDRRSFVELESIISEMVLFVYLRQAWVFSVLSLKNEQCEHTQLR